MGHIAKDTDITAPLKSAEERAKDIVSSDDATAKVAALLKENEELKQPRTAELRTTEAEQKE